MHIFHCETLGGIAVITLDIQSLDATNAADVTERLEGSIPREAPAVVDLGALRYFDLSGFAGIVRWAARPSVRFCSRAKSIHALLELLRAETIITLYHSREEALASLRGFDIPLRKAVGQ